MKSNNFSRLIEDEKVEGWKVKEDGDNRVVMYKPNYGTLGGHAIIALLTVWWTLGIGNALYAAYKYFSHSDNKVVRDEAEGQMEAQSPPSAGFEAEPTLE